MQNINVIFLIMLLSFGQTRLYPLILLVLVLLLLLNNYYYNTHLSVNYIHRFHSVKSRYEIPFCKSMWEVYKTCFTFCSCDYWSQLLCFINLHLQQSEAARALWSVTCGLTRAAYGFETLLCIILPMRFSLIQLGRK